MSVSVIQIAGKQYVAKPGQILDISRISQKEGETIEAQDLLTGKSMKLEVLGHKKGDKVRVSKFKNKTRYERTYGHRSHLTQVKVS